MTDFRRNCLYLDKFGAKLPQKRVVTAGFMGTILALWGHLKSHDSALTEGIMTTRKGIQGQGGFTLVEIAIVLVIVGLLLGGILKGQEMITQAKIKNIVNDFNGLSAAIYSYQDRYRALPGDDRTAAGRWAASNAVSGDGNGVIAGAYNATITTTPTGGQESNSFWWHLRLAGFVPGQTTGAADVTQPNNAANGIVGVQSGAMGFVSNVICTSNLPDKIAIAVDGQMDDGTATSGQVRGQLQTAANENAASDAPAASYGETGQNQYLLCKNL
jgi:prepilin-type N-terminal cleavage/methylation domain-containing protein